jgi:replicative DNA helicase
MTALPQIGRAACVNPDAEYALLGLLMMNGSALRSLGVELKPDHFSEAACQRLFAVIADLLLRGESTGLPSVLPFMATDGQDNTGMARWLAAVASRACTGLEASSYARHIVDLAQRRAVGALCAEVSARALNPDPAVPAQAILEDAESRLRALADQGCNTDARLRPVGQLAAEVIERIETILKGGTRPGISTGFSDLDRQLGGGLYPSDLYLLAGRPSMGKTQLGITIASNIARNRVPTAIFSLEMGSDQLTTRLIGSETRIPYENIRRGEVDVREAEAMVRAQRVLETVPLHISDKAAITAAAMRSEILRLSSRQPIGAVIVDYLQLMTASDRFQGNKVQQVGDISAALKAMAKDLKVPVIALSQLSREVEKRTDKRPQLSDLRESGAIEQDADVVMFVYREEYYLERDPKDSSDPNFLDWNRKLDATKNRCDVLVQKNRHGSVGDVALFFEPPTGRFGNWSGR